jgi:hypothetical protein
MELIGSVDFSWQDFGSQQVGQITADFCQAPTTNLTKHDSHGPDDQPKTIDYHHLGMSRDVGMDEHGIDWLCGYLLAANARALACKTHSDVVSSPMTYGDTLYVYRQKPSPASLSLARIHQTNNSCP